jgi:hypothetical protein
MAEVKRDGFKTGVRCPLVSSWSISRKGSSSTTHALINSCEGNRIIQLTMLNHSRTARYRPRRPINLHSITKNATFSKCRQPRNSNANPPISIQKIKIKNQPTTLRSTPASIWRRAATLAMWVETKRETLFHRPLVRGSRHAKRIEVGLGGAIWGRC